MMFGDPGPAATKLRPALFIRAESFELTSVNLGEALNPAGARLSCVTAR